MPEVAYDATTIRTQIVSYPARNFKLGIFIPCRKYILIGDDTMRHIRHFEETDNMRCYIYLRKSRKDEKYIDEPMEVTLEKHKNTLLDVAKNLGIIIVRIYKEVVSGDTIAARPQMLDMISAIESDTDHIDGVLVMDVDRLGRGNMKDQGFLLELLKWHNIRIVTPDHILDLNDEYDEDSFEDDAHFARRELKRIKRRMQRGRIASLEAGFWIWSVRPYGYDLNKRILVPNPTEAEVVRKMFDLYVNHNCGAGKIVNYLREHNIPRSDGTTDWERTTITRMLQNPVYIGKISKDKRVYKIKDGKRVTSKRKPPEEWTVYEGRHEAIVDEEIFRQAREKAKERYQPHVHINKAVSNPLAFFLKCSVCGKTMRQRTMSTKPNSVRCCCGQTASTYIHVVEAKLVEMLVDYLGEAEIKYSQERTEDALQQERSIMKFALDAAEKELSDLRAQREKQYEMLEKGIYDEQTFLVRSESIRTLIIEAEENVRKCEANLEAVDNSVEIRKMLLPKVQNAREVLLHAYPQFSPEDRNAFLQTLVERVVYEKKKGAKPTDFKLFITPKL